MCIGIPMRVIESWPEGALAVGRNGAGKVDTRLVGECVADDWLLVFQGAARERLDPLRAAEIEAALDLLQAGLDGDLDAAGAAPGFVLPSAMSAAQLAALTGPSGRPDSPTERDPS